MARIKKGQMTAGTKIQIAKSGKMPFLKATIDSVVFMDSPDGATLGNTSTDQVLTNGVVFEVVDGPKRRGANGYNSIKLKIVSDPSERCSSGTEGYAFWEHILITCEMV